jgi:hypothetical protein
MKDLLEDQIYKEARLWKEYSDDQSARYIEMQKDPEYPHISNFKFDIYGFGYQMYEFQQMMIKNKYGIEERNYRNFMDWVAGGKKKFQGIKIEHKIVEENKENE